MLTDDNGDSFDAAPTRQEEHGGEEHHRADDGEHHWFHAPGASQGAEHRSNRGTGRMHRLSDDNGIVNDNTESQQKGEQADHIQSLPR